MLLKTTSLFHIFGFWYMFVMGIDLFALLVEKGDTGYMEP